MLAVLAQTARAEPIEFRADGGVEYRGQVFDSPEAFHRSAAFRDDGLRCRTETPPVLEFSPGDCSSGSTTISSDYEVGEIYRIPVVFHVLMRSDGAGDISDELIRSQIDILNEDFRALPGSLGEPGTDAGIEFYLATTDPDGSPTTGINRHTNTSWYNDSGSFKSSLRWDPRRYLNIYTNTAGGALGYATLPQSSAGSSSDGVVLLWTSVGRDAPMGGAYDKGRTGTHEVGHYLGLYHTFNGGCGTGYTRGDRIADTVPESSPQYECIESASSCGGGSNPIHNYMDYTPDTCMYRFTPEQVNRMRCSLVHYRPELYTAGAPNEPPVPSFDIDIDALRVSLTDASSDPDGAIASWRWDLGDGTTATEQHATHEYAAEGIYTITLAVRDDVGAERTASMEITANVPPIAAFDYDITELTAAFSDASEDPGAIVAWRWDFGDGATATEQHPTHAYATDGVYEVALTVTDDLGGEATTAMSVAVGDAEPPGGDAGPDGGVDTVTGGCGCDAGRGAPPGGALLLALASLALLSRRRRA